MPDFDSFLDLNLDNIPEFTQIPDGEERLVRIRKFEQTTKKDDKTKPMWHIVLDDPNDSTIDDIHAYIVLPTDDLKNSDLKAYNKSRMRIRTFMDCFRLDYSSGIDTSTFEGAEGYVLVGLEDGEQGPRNTVKQWVVGN